VEGAGAGLIVVVVHILLMVMEELVLVVQVDNTMLTLPVKINQGVHTVLGEVVMYTDNLLLVPVVMAVQA
jgi:hypothetical protein